MAIQNSITRKVVINICSVWSLLLSLSVNAQTNVSVVAPLFQNVFSALRTPSTEQSAAYRNAIFFISKHEMAPYARLSITSMSIPISVNGNQNTSAAVGNFTLYMSNTTDQTAAFSANFNSNLAGMTTVYSGTLLIPASGAPFMSVNFQTPFTYTGANIHLAFKWTFPGPYSATPVYVDCANSFSSTIVNGTQFWTASSSSSVSTAPSNLQYAIFRPSFVFGSQSPKDPDLSVLDVRTDRTKLIGNNTGDIDAYVCNSGTTSVQNVTVNLICAGANTFTQNLTIPNFAAGSTQTVTFGNINLPVAGTNNFSVVIVNADTLPANNKIRWTEYSTCMNVSAGLNFTGGGAYLSVSNSTIVAYQMNATQTRTLGGIRFLLAPANFTNSPQITGVLMDSFGTIIATSNTITLTNQTGMIDLPFTSLVQINSGQTYFYGIQQSLGPNYCVALTFPADISTPQAYLIPSGGGMPTNMNYIVGRAFAMFAYTPVAPLNISVSSNTFVCAGSPITLTASGAPSFSWSTGAFGNSIVYTPSVTSTIYATGSTSNCNVTKGINITVSPNTLASITTPTNLCIGVSVFTSSPAYSYTWSDGSSTRQASFSFSTAGVYQVSLSIQNNPCPTSSTSLQFTVRANPSVNLINVPEAICNQSKGGTAIQLTAYPSGGVYSGSGISSTGVFTPGINGSYPIIYTYKSAVSGCVGTATTNLLVNECTSLVSNNLQQSISVYPNPLNTDCFWISGINEGSVRIYNSCGQFQGESPISNGKVKMIDVSSGLYILEVYSNHQLLGTTRLMVSH